MRLILVAVALGCAQPAPAADVTVTLDASMKLQRIDGFGGSLTLFEDTGIFNRHDATQPSNTSATPAQKQRIADLLYREIGITRTRVFPAAFEPQPGSFTWSLVDPLIDWVALAGPSGLTTAFASFGTNGGTRSEAWLRRPDDACALDTKRLDDYVAWQVAAAQRFRDRGQELPFITINNEPDFCPIGGNPTPYFLNPVHFVEAVKRLGAGLAANGLAAKIVITDGVTPGSSLPYIRATLEDATARAYVGAIAYHSYDGYQDPATLRASAAGTPQNPHVRAELRALADRYGLPLWMTEVCFCTPQAGLSDDQLVLLRVNHLLDELTLTRVNAFDVMNVFFIGRPGVRDELVEVAFNADGTLASAAISTYGRAIGHFAQAAPPGSTRIAAVSSDPRVRAVAFARPDGQIAVVLVNNADVELRVAVADGSVMVPASGIVTLFDAVTGAGTSRD